MLTPQAADGVASSTYFDSMRVPVLDVVAKDVSLGGIDTETCNCFRKNDVSGGATGQTLSHSSEDALERTKPISVMSTPSGTSITSVFAISTSDSMHRLPGARGLDNSPYRLEAKKNQPAEHARTLRNALAATPLTSGAEGARNPDCTLLDWMSRVVRCCRDYIRRKEGRIHSSGAVSDRGSNDNIG